MARRRAATAVIGRTAAATAGANVAVPVTGPGDDGSYQSTGRDGGGPPRRPGSREPRPASGRWGGRTTAPPEVLAPAATGVPGIGIRTDRSREGGGERREYGRPRSDGRQRPTASSTWDRAPGRDRDDRGDDRRGRPDRMRPRVGHGTARRIGEDRPTIGAAGTSGRAATPEVIPVRGDRFPERDRDDRGPRDYRRPSSDYRPRDDRQRDDRGPRDDRRPTGRIDRTSRPGTPRAAAATVTRPVPWRRRSTVR